MGDNIKISPLKGRPVLHWIDKNAPREVKDYPAQLVESFGVEKALPSPNWKSLEQRWNNLLFHGDNMEILATLLVGGFRGKVDLIYIDPPFDSGANYVRRVALRGRKDKVLEGEEVSVTEEKQYEDIWANDTYLQYMYERLILLRELLSEQGNIYLHCDWHKSHHLRFLMDEIFGVDNFRNEIIWQRKRGSATDKSIAKSHDNLLLYSKTENYIFKQIYLDHDQEYTDATYNKRDEKGQYRIHDLVASPNLGGSSPRFEYKGFVPKTRWLLSREKVEELEKKDCIVWSKTGTPYRKIYLHESQGVPLNSIWKDIPSVPLDSIWKDIPNVQGNQKSDFPTQKPEKLLERIIEASSNKGSLVMDCFCGSGTTAVVAQRLARRWVACDMNKGAIQTTLKRLLGSSSPSITEPPLAIAHYRVNNYDFQKQNAIKELIEQKYGVERTPSDLFFDGISDRKLIKIAPLNRPLSAKDIEEIRAELKNRPKEERHILLIGYGSERSVYDKADEHNRLRTINEIKVHDAQKDNITKASPPEAEIDFKEQGDSVSVTLKAFVSPGILQRMNIDRTIFDEDIKDFRATIDCILIDNDYDGKTFRIVISDIPAKKSDFVKATYSVKRPHAKAVVAVKIIDMLGEETLILHPDALPAASPPRKPLIP